MYDSMGKCKHGCFSTLHKMMGRIINEQSFTMWHQSRSEIQYSFIKYEKLIKHENPRNIPQLTTNTKTWITHA